MDIVLKCNNLTFRKPTLEDVGELLILKNNLKASFLLKGNTPTYKVESLQRWIEFHANNKEEVLFLVYDETVKKIIGHVGLYKIDISSNKAEYGILLADDSSRGKGYGTMCTRTMIDFAFDVLKLHKVYSEIITENKASEAMFRKCGFKTDGMLREDIFKNGRYYNVLIMSILESER